MSSASSASSCSIHRRSVTGVPMKCWCGKNLRIFVSQTDDNPCRRFYRCEIALQRKTEAHLFKWIDEALFDETKMVDAKLMRLVDEVKVLSKEMVDNYESQSKAILYIEEEMKHKIKEKMKEEMMMVNASMQSMSAEMAKRSMERAVVIAVVVGAVGWLCGKFL